MCRHNQGLSCGDLNPSLIKGHGTKDIKMHLGVNSYFECIS